MWWISAPPSPISPQARAALARRWAVVGVLLSLAFVVIPLVMAGAATYLMVRDTAARGLQWTAFVSVLGAWIPFLVLHRSLRREGLLFPTTWFLTALMTCTVQVFIGISPAVVYEPRSISDSAYLVGFGLDAVAVVLALAATAVLLAGKPRELAETTFTVVWKLRSRPKGTVELEKTRLHWSIRSPLYNSSATARGQYALGDLAVTPSPFIPSADRIQWTVATSRQKNIPAHTDPGPGVLLGGGGQPRQQIPLDKADELVDFVQRRVAFYRQAAPELLAVKSDKKG
ncbi:hypothetical protein [Kutzneria sp. NPDC052558]|uniref:hypothetical protein n=1 Tax=Kutzneria sp. NPDC052558 TaxID=3364121 RepID=UPI0037C7E8A0